MTTLFSVEPGYKELPTLSRVLSSIIVIANIANEVLLFAKRHYPESLSACAEHRLLEVEHVLVKWPDGLVDIVEK